MEEQWYDRDGEVVRREVNGERVLTVEIGAHRRAFTDALWRQSVREYDDWDNLIAVTYPDGTGERYRVSPADSSRLERIDARGIRTRYDYDARGNRLSAAHTEGPWEYNAANQLEGYPGASYHYDANGNTTEKTEAGLTTRYSYDAEDRLSEVRDESGNLLARYAYDPFGRRLAKTRDGTTTYFLYADEGLIAELDAAGTVQQAYGWAPDSLWGTEPLYTEANGERGFYLTDHLGTPHKLIAPNGATLWAATYQAFGQAEIGPASRLANPLRFPGQYFDPETGLHYNYFRDYDPSTGRDVESDPIGLEAGINTYLYGEANPTRFIDPLGLFSSLELCKNPRNFEACTAAGMVPKNPPRPAPVPVAVPKEQCDEEDDDPNCDEHFTRCLDSSLADLPGSVYGSSRCGVCRDQCVRNGGKWPDIAITGSGAVRCDYWNFQ